MGWININGNWIGRNRGGGISLSSYWTPTFEFFWYEGSGNITDTELIDKSGNGNNITITGKDFSTSYIPVTSAATFAMPAKGILYASDRDGLWYNNEVPRAVTVAKLIGYDFSRTIIRYNSAAPYNITAIAILKYNITLTSAQYDKLHRDFRLPVFWSGLFNQNGFIKGNRGLVKSVYTPETVPANYFIYKGVFWPYREVTNPVTGKTWMDRNLGASRVATSKTDSLAYGDLFQFGRLDDGHQKRDSLTTDVLSPTDIPGHAKFITNESSPYNWRATDNLLLWQEPAYINLPAPTGWRIPTELEISAEIATWASTADRTNDAFNSILKLPVGGRRLNDGSLNVVGTTGYFWANTNTGRVIRITTSSATFASMLKAMGIPIRLIKI